MLRLGSLNLALPFFQAPLSGYSDYAMRHLAKLYGAPLTFAGVIIDKSAVHPKIIRKPAFRPGDDEHPIGAQIMGTESDTMAKAAKALVDTGYDLIDLNFACPAPKVLRGGRGGHLMNEPKTAIEICRRVRESVDCPVIMKLRIGFDDTPASIDNFWQIASSAPDAGIDAIVVHGRYVLQKFTGSANWDIFPQLKSTIPKMTIIGSGDLFDAKTISERFANTGVDGIVIARGAVGNPWIFRDLAALFSGKPIPPPPTLEEVGMAILEHLELVCRLYDPNRAVRYLRKFIVGYCKHHPERKKALKAILAAKDKSQLEDAVKWWYKI